MKIYHNPRCSKSRGALSLLEEKGIVVEIIKYLEDIPNAEELKDVLKKLGMKAEDIVRKGEKDYKENFKGKILSEDEWITALIKYPKLIERPIVVKGDRAVVGRPVENILDLI
ncbi:MAG TPA: arsenate reductase (glutaredoxin) [Brumimicrobium sp.]|nr:arsenate reductase (glutaredoxin) [Brumimicrobium sp.]